MIHHGDCLDVMAGMDADSIDAIVTDPPYGLEFMGKGWDSHGVPGVPFWTQALRVAKPGAYLLAFGGTRTVHRLTVALEDAGWIIRDVLVWAYAQGFPKSKSSLKPAWEPIVLARKPGPLAPLNIDGCRIGTDERFNPPAGNDGTEPVPIIGSNGEYAGQNVRGRWPANVVLTDPIFDEASRFFLIPKASRKDREPKVPGELEEGYQSSQNKLQGAEVYQNRCSACGSHLAYENQVHCGEPTKRIKTAGSPRYNTHPTVKPSRLMRHLVRLVTPKGGTVLDPFLGSGTTALAAAQEGFDWVGIEREAEYVRIAEQRLVEPATQMELPA